MIEKAKDYLDGKIDLDTLENYVLPLVWDKKFDDETTYDEELMVFILFQIVYINDCVLTEQAFKVSLKERLSALDKSENL